MSTGAGKMIYPVFSHFDVRKILGGNDPGHNINPFLCGKLAENAG
jgi:hypothetical protein